MTGRPPELDAAVVGALGDALAGALRGDQASIETLGRGFSRRDPVAGLDPLPQGRDAVTYSTAAVSTAHEAGQHWPELIAFRASDRFPTDDRSAPASAPAGVPPALAYLPTWLVGRMADLPAAAAFPGAPPFGDRATVRPPATPPAPTAEGMPPWLRGPTPPPAMPERGVARDLRRDFPALDQRVNGHRLVWLDSAATTHKPRAVLDAVSHFYERDNSNVHRGAHTLAARATDAFEEARKKVARHLGAASPHECVFVRGATEAINLVAQTWGVENVGPGDEILVTWLEHHANIVPWQQLAHRRGARLRPVPVDDRGDVDLDAFDALLSPRVKVLAVTQVSNALGTVVPVEILAARAHAHGARVLVDGAQSVAHPPVDVRTLGADFFVFSGHKVYGPTGIGVLWARPELLAAMPPWQGGGSMIRDVTFERTLYAEPPAKFEAGTPHLAGAVGLGAALDYVASVGRSQIAANEHALLERLVAELRELPGLRIVGEPRERADAVSFVMPRHEPAAIARHLDHHGIAVRAGHHCAQPVLRRFGHEATVRPSLGLYSVPAEVDALVAALRTLR